MNTTLIELYLDKEPYRSRIMVNGVAIPGVTAVNLVATDYEPPEVTLRFDNARVRVTAMALLGIEPEEPELPAEKPLPTVWGET